MQFLAPDTLRCRTLLVGETELMALSHDTIDHWQSVLSGAERFVVAELLRGRSNREIAALRGRDCRSAGDGSRGSPPESSLAWRRRNPPCEA